MKKICIDCKVEKEISLFQKTTAASKDGRINQCKTCKLIYQKKYIAKNSRYIKTKLTYKNGIHPSDPNYMRNNQLIADFGISLKQYNDMFVQQNGECFICKIHQSKLKKSLCVDHDHHSGQVRKLLCPKCNSAIGFLKESSLIAKAATEYLIYFNK